MTNLPGLSQAQLNSLCSELDTLRGQNRGVVAALLATTDGFEVADSGDWRGCPSSSVAAMTSSMLSLAIAMVRETGLTSCQNLIIETEEGKVLVMSVPGSKFQMLLTVMTVKDIAFGQLLLEAKITVRQLSNILDSV